MRRLSVVISDGRWIIAARGEPASPAVIKGYIAKRMIICGETP